MIAMTNWALGKYCPDCRTGIPNATQRGVIDVRRYVMAESSHNTGALRVSRYEFHLLRIAWVGHVPAT